MHCRSRELDTVRAYLYLVSVLWLFLVEVRCYNRRTCGKVLKLLIESMVGEVCLG